MIQNIIFDFGGVILPISEENCHESFAELGAHQDLFDQKELFHPYERGEVSTQQFLNSLQPHFFRKKIFLPDLAQAWQSMCCYPLPADNVDFIQSLKKDYNLFLLSNTNELHIQKLKKDNGPFLYNKLLRQFQGVHYSYEMGLRKPDKTIFEKILNTHKLKAEETFYVDDNKKNAKAARKLGLETWHFDPEKDKLKHLTAKLEKYKKAEPQA